MDAKQSLFWASNHDRKWCFGIALSFLIHDGYIFQISFLEKKVVHFCKSKVQMSGHFLSELLC